MTANRQEYSSRDDNKWRQELGQKYVGRVRSGLRSGRRRSKMVGQKLGAEVRERVEKIFKKKMKQLGVKAGLQLNMVRSIWGSPIVGENVYGEAFPFENPPRVWLEVFAPDATEKEITKTICHELVHVKCPELKDGDPELERKVQACVRWRV